MARAALRAEIAQLRRVIEDRAARADPVVSRLRADPVRILTDAGIQPDPWQARVLRSAAARMLMLASRQSGKSLTASSLALHTALTQPAALVLLLSPTLRQSGELFR